MEIEHIAHLISYENQPRSLKQRRLLGRKISCLGIDLGGHSVLASFYLNV